MQTYISVEWQIAVKEFERLLNQNTIFHWRPCEKKKNQDASFIPWVIIEYEQTQNIIKDILLQKPRGKISIYSYFTIFFYSEPPSIVKCYSGKM